MNVLEPDVRDDNLYYGEWFWASVRLSGFFWREEFNAGSPFYRFSTTRYFMRNAFRADRMFRRTRHFDDELEAWEYSRKLCSRYNRLFGPSFDPELLPVWRAYWSLQK